VGRVLKAGLLYFGGYLYHASDPGTLREYCVVSSAKHSPDSDTSLGRGLCCPSACSFFIVIVSCTGRGR